jgi:hypothetical protein
LLIAVVVGAVMSFSVSDALARAGGGGGYSGGGGGGSGGSGGGGGDGGGELLFRLIWLCSRHPYIGVPLLIVVGVAMYYGGHKGKGAYQGKVIRRGNMALDEVKRLAAVKKVRAGDSGFIEEVFYDRVRVAFLKIQDGWCAQNLEAVRPFVSDGIFERFSLQIQEQHDLGYRNVMENVRVHQVLLAQVETDEFFDLLTICVQAAATDYRVQLEDNRKISGSQRDEQFIEYWTFLRKRGAQTGEGPGLIEGSCPNCGADIALNQGSKCQSCDSLLRNGQYDWVLCEITQDCEWTGREKKSVSGMAEYQQASDPGFNVQHLEDRASVVFWRKVMADRLGDVGPLAKMALPEFCEEYQEQLTGDDSARRYWGDCAVGSVETLGVLPGDEMDRALIEVRWSGRVFDASAGAPPVQTKHGSAFRDLFILARRARVKSDVGQTVASSHCPGCGAPESSLASHACEFCGEVLNTGSHDWVLSDILAMSGLDATNLVGQAREQATAMAPVEGELVELNGAARTPRGTELLSWAVKMALADNELDEKEQKMLNRVAKNRHVDAQTMEVVIDAARRGELDVPEPADRDEARRWLNSLADVSLWDGRVHTEEFNLLCQAGKRFEYSAYDIKNLLKKRKAQMYQAARKQLRSAQQNSNA